MQFDYSNKKIDPVLHTRLFSGFIFSLSLFLHVCNILLCLKGATGVEMHLGRIFFSGCKRVSSR